MKNKKWKQLQLQKQQLQQLQILSQSALDNLDEIESEIETSSQYFKPKPGRNYIIRIDPQDKIQAVETERFKDAHRKPVKRYEFKIVHVNNGKEQLWDTSKTVCTQIIAELKKGLNVLKVTRSGSESYNYKHFDDFVSDLIKEDIERE